MCEYCGCQDTATIAEPTRERADAGSGHVVRTAASLGTGRGRDDHQHDHH